MSTVTTSVRESTRGTDTVTIIGGLLFAAAFTLEGSTQAAFQSTRSLGGFVVLALIAIAGVLLATVALDSVRSLRGRISRIGIAGVLVGGAAHLLMAIGVLINASAAASATADDFGSGLAFVGLIGIGIGVGVAGLDLLRTRTAMRAGVLFVLALPLLAIGLAVGDELSTALGFDPVLIAYGIVIGLGWVLLSATPERLPSGAL